MDWIQDERLSPHFAVKVVMPSCALALDQPRSILRLSIVPRWAHVLLQNTAGGGGRPKSAAAAAAVRRARSGHGNCWKHGNRRAIRAAPDGRPQSYLKGGTKKHKTSPEPIGGAKGELAGADPARRGARGAPSDGTVMHHMASLCIR